MSFSGFGLHTVIVGLETLLYFLIGAPRCSLVVSNSRGTSPFSPGTELGQTSINFEIFNSAAGSLTKSNPSRRTKKKRLVIARSIRPSAWIEKQKFVAVRRSSGPQPAPNQARLGRGIESTTCQRGSRSQGASLQSEAAGAWRWG